MAKKMKREDMGYNKAKLVCSNWVQPNGFCDFHSTITFETMLEKARNGFRNHE